MKKQTNSAAIIPTLRYQDAQSAIECLCEAFGFKKHLVIQGDNNSIAHAQLTLGNAMIMLSSATNDDYGKLIQTPKNLNGVNTQAPYIIVEDIDEHYKKAVEAGVDIVIEIKDEDYGGRGYTCRDLEGNLWNFGSYNPWNE